MLREERIRPNIVQEAPQWPTLISLVAAGLGVSLAPACVAKVTIPGAVYRKVQAAGRSTVDMAVKVGAEKVLAEKFLGIAKEQSKTEFHRHLQDAG